MTETTVYHGTTKASATLIKNQKQFQNSDKDTEWLGKGAYFFAYKTNADWWTSHKRFEHQKTCVLESILEYEKEEILDLDDQETLDKVNLLMKNVVESYQEIGMKMNRWSDEKCQCFVCNFIQKLMPMIKIRCYTFPVQQGKCVPFRFGKNQKQYCVVDQSVIKEVDGEKWR